MTEPPEKSFPKQAIELVRQIPKGKIVSYGQIAEALGHPKAARIVGGALGKLGPEHLDVPWFRVLNKAGGISPRSDFFSDRDPIIDQAERLLEEGLEPNAQGLYDYSVHGLTRQELAKLARKIR